MLTVPQSVGGLAKALAVAELAWTLDVLRDKRRVEAGELVITWKPGQNSIHDTSFIAAGRDVGNVADGFDYRNLNKEFMPSPYHAAPWHPGALRYFHVAGMM